MVPKSISSHDYEFVLGWLELNCVELRLRDHTDLVRDQISDCSRDLKTWVHPGPQEDTRHA